MAWPSTPLTVEVSLALGADLTDTSGWSFTDVTQYTRSTGGITITRGRRDEQSEATPSTCLLTFDNTDGRFVPRNPLGPYYGQLVRNTPVRVRVDPGTGFVTRFTGFISQWPPRWDVSGNNNWVEIRADGVLRRLGQGRSPLRSALFRAIEAAAPVAYWPCEDETSSLSVAEAAGGNAMVLTGTSPTFASDGSGGSDPVIELANGTVLTGTSPTITSTGAWSLAFLINIPTAVGASTTLATWKTNGSLPHWQLVLAPGSPDTLTMTAFDGAGVSQISTSPSFATSATTEPYGQWIMIVVTAAQNGADLDWTITVYDAASGAGASGTETSATSGYVLTVITAADSTLAGSFVGHYALWDIDIGTPTAVFTAIDGYTGQTPEARATALADGEGIPFTPSGISSGQTMGPQTSAALIDLLLEAEAAAQGVLYELTDSSLTIQMPGDRYDQSVDLTVDYGSTVPPLEPTDDDLLIRNDVTVARVNGSSARVVDAAGPLGTGNVGTYDEFQSINMGLDSAAAHYAGWQVNVGTADQYRFPGINLNLRASTSLIASWLACDVGSRISLTNLPANISYDDVDLVLEGYREYLAQYDWLVELNCAPYVPYRVFQVANTSGDTSEWLGRLAEDENCAIRGSLTSVATSVPFDPSTYRWTTVADDFPMTVRFGGETATVSSIATTVATYVAAGAASHADNAAVTPALYAGNTVQDLILVLAAIRSSGTGTLVTPTGYTRLPVWASTENVQLFAKVHSGSESNPTVTPSGGSAGDTVSAITFGLRSMPISLTDLADIVVDSATQLNASAQNIAYPALFPRFQEGCVVLALGWKQDDDTSVAALSGFTEALDVTTTTGNDQSLVADYVIQTTPARIDASSFVVTGGASAISRGAVVALAGGFQTLTLSARSVNGVVKSHTASTRLEIEDAKVIAL